MVTRVHHATTHHAAHSVPKFASAKHTENTLNGITGKVKQYSTSSSVTASLKKATTDNWVLYGSTFKIDPKQLKQAMASPASFKALGYSLIFRADGSTPGSSKGNGWGGTGSPGPHMSMTPLTKKTEAYAKVMDTLNPQFTQGADPSLKKGVDAGARAALESMLHEPNTKLYWAHWDNQDDTTINGVVSVNEQTGEVRTLGLFAPA